MKTLKFTEENKETYDILYETLRARSVTGIEMIIKAATVVEKFKTVGVDKDEIKSSFRAMKLKTVPTDLELEDDHFAYVKECFNSAPIATSVQIELLSQTAKLLKNVDS